MELLVNRSMKMVDSDTELLRCIAAGDEDALRRLVALYGQRLYAYALQITRDPALADEAVQESLVVVWQKAGRFRQEGRAAAWLLGIVHHKALNQIRGNANQSIDEDWDATPARGPLPDEQASAADQRRLIRAGLEHLSVEHRAGLELVFYQGLSLNEVAEVTGCPLGTVKSRLNYAKASLRGVLNRAGYHAEDIVG